MQVLLQRGDGWENSTFKGGQWGAVGGKIHESGEKWGRRWGIVVKGGEVW
ncbi:hypothetical protein DC3_38470 [Deinococcus cellulosilyticus NBRC 106333 = KACC 11606]|uniref:Uncharacterized protein n=1 Tax=Deinococcus cellulosilyticus (strain DSM 18568 / NBRC 106333 / KACC 11606 / 5516J-15) TaxID=1223518 RepID=A0A511N5S3_DEIC1|nr:hypothetical protein DC3_38470 [Deinococcus cellulosilyticus NBRC 106333 = KACC 11606]